MTRVPRSFDLIKKMNRTTKVTIVVVVICACVILYFIFYKNKNPQSLATTSPIPTTQSSSTPVSPQTSTFVHGVYQNQYLKITVPSSWILTEVTQTIQNEKYDWTTQRSVPIGAPVTKKTGAINLTKGNYILYINPRVTQASGIEGGRFEEYAGGSPSVGAVVVEHPGGPCGTSEKSMLSLNSTTTSRTDFYIGSGDKTETCATTTNGETVWYFSDVGEGINYYNFPNDPTPVGWVVTMAYNSSIINSLPTKNSTELNQMLSEMTNILKTLKINLNPVN